MENAVTLGALMVALVVVPAARADEAPPQDRCVMGGFKAGGPAPNMKTQTGAVKRKPTVYEAKGGQFYWIGGGNVFVRTLDGKVVDVVREWEGDDAGKVYGALVEKYGEPTAPTPIMPTVKSSYVLFGGSIRFETRVAWIDQDCGQRIELIRQDKSVITGFGGGSSGRVTVVVSAMDIDPTTGESNLLK